MRKPWTRWLGLLLLAAATTMTVTARAGDLDAVKRNFAKRFPKLEVRKIAPAPVDGLYQVLVGNRILYTDANADYVLLGNLIYARTRQNLTAKQLHQWLRVDFSKLPLSDAIKVVHGDGSRILAVFADPDCPFCKRLEHALQSVPNVTVYTFLFPIDQLHPGATKLSEAIWCAPDRAKAWETHMLHGTVPSAPGSCKNPVARNVKLGHELGISSTPTLVFPDGNVVIGAIGAPRLNQLLDAYRELPKPPAGGKAR